jgi:hypothetical protein
LEEGCKGAADRLRVGTVKRIPGGFKVLDANQQSLAYVYSREKPDDAYDVALAAERVHSDGADAAWLLE